MPLLRLFEFMMPHTHLNRSLRILIIVNTLMVFALGLFSPFYAVFVEKIGGSIAFAGFSWAMLSVVQGVLILIFTNWELKVKETELLLVFGYFMRGVVFLSYAFMNSLPQLIVTQILWGIAAAVGVPAFDATYSAHTSKDSSIAQWSGWEGIAAIAIGIAAFIGGTIIELFGYGFIFLLMAGISFFIAIYIWRLPREVL